MSLKATKTKMAVEAVFGRIVLISAERNEKQKTLIIPVKWLKSYTLEILKIITKADELFA